MVWRATVADIAKEDVELAIDKWILFMHITGAQKPQTDETASWWGARIASKNGLFNLVVTTKWRGEVSIVQHQVARFYVLISPHHLVVTPRLNSTPAQKSAEAAAKLQKWSSLLLDQTIIDMPRRPAPSHVQMRCILYSSAALSRWRGLKGGAVIWRVSFGMWAEQELPTRKY